MEGGAPGRQTGRGLAAVRRRLRGLLGETGAAAVEFAMVGPMFLLMILWTMQLCAIIFMNQVLQTATYTVGRQYMTGQLDATNGTAAQISSVGQLKTYVCSQMVQIFDCSKLMVDMEVANSASTLSESPLNLYACSGSGANLSCTPGNGNFSASVPQQFAILRVMYPFPNILGGWYKNEPDGTFLMTGTSVFLVEPYNASNNVS
jgi:Flp pilus assembly protein TadG